MKKLLAIFMTVMLGIPAAAAADTYKFEYSGEETNGLAVIFDDNYKLSEVKSCVLNVKDNTASAEISADGAKNVWVFLPKSMQMIKEFITDSGDDTKDDIKGDTTEDDKLNPAYPTAMDSATAFMMVKEINSVSVDDETKTSLKVLFRGEERELLVDEDMTIDSAPIANSALKHDSVSALKAGDIIYCTTNLSGKLRTVELIFRPLSGDIITDTADYGVNFERLYSADGQRVSVRNPIPIGVFGGNNSKERQYAFGAVKEIGTTYFTLCNKAGRTSQDINVDITSDTIVYVYDKSKKNGNIHIGDISDIIGCGFDTDAKDDADNVTDWSKTFERHYALVKMAKGTATEIALYLNY